MRSLVMMIEATRIYKVGDVMTLSIRDPETDKLVRALAKRKGIGLTDAVRLAVGAELQRLDETTPLRNRIAAIAARVVAHERTGKIADKAFFDDLSGNL